MSTAEFKSRIHQERENYSRTCDLACERLDDLERAGIPPSQVTADVSDWVFFWGAPNGSGYYYSCEWCNVTTVWKNGEYRRLQRDGALGETDPEMDWEETVRALQLALKRGQP